MPKKKEKAQVDAKTEAVFVRKGNGIILDTIVFQ